MVWIAAGVVVEVMRRGGIWVYLEDRAHAFSDGLDVRYERKRGVNETPAEGLEGWHCCYLRREGCGQSR